MATLGVFLSKSFDELIAKKNDILYLGFFLVILPSLLVAIAQQFLPEPFLSVDYFRVLFSSPSLYVYVLFSIISMILMLLFSLSIYSMTLSKKGLIGDFFAEARSNFWKYLLYLIVSYFLLFLLFLAFIIPGIIFSIFWILGVYVFLNQKKGIFQSLSESKKLVTGNWWRILGYLLMVTLLVMLISMVVSIVSVLISLIPFIGSYIESLIDSTLLVFTISYTIIFFKHVYYSLR